MKAGWEIKRLGEVCEYARGLTYKKADEVEHSTKRVLRANNIDRDASALDFSEIRYLREDFEIRSAKKVSRGSILICTASGSKSHLGKVALVDIDQDFAFGGFMGLITPTNGLLPQFLHYAMTSQAYIDFIDQNTDGANINNLKFSQLAEFAIPIPPLEEQKRIVAILDAAFEGLTRAKENADANLQNARELFESTVSELLSNPQQDWTRGKLTDFCEKITVGHVGPMATKYVDNGIPFLRSQNVRPFHVDLENVKFVDEEFHAELKKSELCPGDVAIVRTGYPGTSAVIPETLIVANCADLVIAKTGPKLDAHFLALLLNSDYGKKLVAGAAVGAAQKHFNVGAAKAALFDFPPLQIQHELVVKLDFARKQLKTLEQLGATKLTDIADLRQSLLQKAFAGELT